MKNTRFYQVFQSRYCLFVFVLMLFLSYFLVPQKIFYGFYSLIGVFFIISFSLTFTCLVKSIKDQIIAQRKQKIKSIVGVISGLIGLSALHACTLGAPVCGVSIGMGIVAAIFPAVAFNFLNDYALWIIMISIIIQMFSLNQLKCFRGMKIF